MKKIFPFILIFLAVLILYHPILSVYFSQDDFFHFKISQTDGSLSDFINLFGFHPFEERGIAFYRPLFREFLYNIYYSIFGLNHLYFRIFSFILHFINIILVFIFVQKVFQRKELSFFVSFFFGITAANVALLYYLAGGIQALGVTFFLLLTLIFFTSYIQHKDFKYLIFCFLTFLFALASHELAVVIPFLLIGIYFVYLPYKKAFFEIKKLWPFFLILLIYLYLDVTKIGFSSGEQQYQAIFNIKTFLNSLAWYSVWAFGLPEMLIDFVLPGLNLNPNLMRYWGNYFIIIFSAFFIALIILGFSTIYILLKNKKLFNKKFLFFALWFPIGTFPILFLPLHKSTYYLAPSLPAFWTVIGFLIFNAYWIMNKKNLYFSKIILAIFIAAIFVVSATSAILGKNTYWAASRGRLAEDLINQVKSKYSNLPKGSAIYFTNDPNYPFRAKAWGGSSKQASLILNNEDALQLVYKDFALRVFYEDLGGIPQGYPQSNLYPIVAQLKE